MNEILYGIRVIKMYTWEDHFKKRVGELRDAELSSLKGRKYLDALCVYFWATTPVLISILTFTTYALLGHELTAAKVQLTESNEITVAYPAVTNPSCIISCVKTINVDFVDFSPMFKMDIFIFIYCLWSIFMSTKSQL